MKDIQIVWDDNFGSVLQLKINNPICSERFNEIIKYLQAIEIHNNADAHVFFIQDKYIFVFYEELIESEKTFLNKIKNHFRTCKNSLHIDDYKLDILTTEDAAQSFNDWLMKLIVKTKDGETVISKSSIVANDYIRDFNELNHDKIGKLKIEKEIVKINDNIDIVDNEVNEIVNENIILDVQIEKENNELQELIDKRNKQTDLLTHIREERQKVILENKKKKESIQNIKDKKAEVIEEVERGKTQIIKSVIDEFFVVSNDKKDCVSKKVFCDMLQLDYNSKIDIRLLSTILKEYDVVYNRVKRIKGVAGAYFGIKLLE